MQNRYAGDIGDFSKFWLLRLLSRDFSIGINWYNSGTPDFELEHNGKFKQNDGRFRRFDCVKSYDEELVNALESLKNEHSISKLEKLNLIDNAIYYSKILPIDKEQRFKWHNNAVKKLEKSDIVFLDPDNGLICKSISRSSPKSIKYTYYDEVYDYLSQSKTVIIYNHRNRKKEDVYFNEIINKLCNEAFSDRNNIQILSFHRYSVRDYFIISKDYDTHKKIECLIQSGIAFNKKDNIKPTFTLYFPERTK